MKRAAVISLIAIALGALLLLALSPSGFDLKPGPTSAPGIKPTTDILKSLRGTAEAEGVPEARLPSRAEPSGKTEPQSLWQWWDDIRLAHWVIA